MLVDGFGRRRYHATTWAVAVRAVAEEEKEEDSPLESKLRRLALLNGGEGVNPRSRHQVSKLLYPEDDVGPTDKATLQRIMVGADKNDGDDEDRGMVIMLIVVRVIMIVLVLV